MSLVHNEQTKLLANALDRASTACFTVGLATPIAAFVYGIGSFRPILASLWLPVVFSGWLAVSIALHLIARSILGRLKG